MSTFDNVTVNEDINGVIGDYIVEVGSNDNGNYVKYNSGRLVMWGMKQFSGVDIYVRENNTMYMYNSIHMNLDFPMTSLTACVVQLMNCSGTGAFVSGSATVADGYLKSKVGFWFYHGTPIYDTNQCVHWLAIGTWK